MKARLGRGSWATLGAVAAVTLAVATAVGPGGIVPGVGFVQGSGPADRLGGSIEPTASRPVDERRVLVSRSLSPAEHDPFEVVLGTPLADTSPPEVGPDLASMPAEPAVAAPAPLPAAPALALQYAGRMRAPDGAWRVFALQADEFVELQPGSVLASGHRVEAVDDREVRFVIPPLDQVDRLELPPLPVHEWR